MRSLARRAAQEKWAQHGTRTTHRVMDSGSMVPLLRGEQIVRIDWNVPKDRAIIGSVLLIELEGELLIVHRAADYRKSDNHSQVLQVADNYRIGDPYSGLWVDEEQLLGVVEAIQVKEQRIIDLQSSIARRAGRMVAASSRYLWMSDGSRFRTILVGPTFIIQRVTVHLVARLLQSIAERGDL